MSNDVTRVLAELRRDHKNMNLCLDVLEHEANRMYDNEVPDFEIIRDAMNYMTVYPDAVHHPKEDRLYAQLKTVRPDLSRGFDRIADDHCRIAEDGLELRSDLESITSGSFVRRRKVVADALRYVNNLRSHMQWEELDLFKRCETMALEGWDFYVEDIFIDRVDPVFGRQTEARFNRLVNGIQATRAAVHI
ncbi:MAG: hemerythrin domain-containing protein [Pseudomonadota bacterium]